MDTTPSQSDREMNWWGAVVFAALTLAAILNSCTDGLTPRDGWPGGRSLASEVLR